MARTQRIQRVCCLLFCVVVVVFCVCLFCFFTRASKELNGTKTYKETSTDEKTVVNSHLNELPLKFSVGVKESQDKLPMMY